MSVWLFNDFLCTDPDRTSSAFSYQMIAVVFSCWSVTPMRQIREGWSPHTPYDHRTFFLMWMSWVKSMLFSGWHLSYLSQIRLLVFIIVFFFSRIFYGACDGLLYGKDFFSLLKAVRYPIFENEVSFKYTQVLLNNQVLGL